MVVFEIKGIHVVTLECVCVGGGGGGGGGSLLLLPGADLGCVQGVRIFLATFSRA